MLAWSNLSEPEQLLAPPIMLPGQQAAAWEALTALPLDGSDSFALCGTIGRLTRTAAKWWIATRP